MKFTMILPMLSIFALSGCVDPMNIEPQSTNVIVEKYKNTDDTTINKIENTPIKITNVDDIEKDKKMAMYTLKMKQIAQTIKSDRNYKKISFNTKEKKAWFRELTYRLWDKQITEEEFINEALEKYPTHRYEFEFIIDGFNS